MEVKIGDIGKFKNDASGGMYFARITKVDKHKYYSDYYLSESGLSINNKPTTFGKSIYEVVEISSEEIDRFAILETRLKEGLVFEGFRVGDVIVSIKHRLHRPEGYMTKVYEGSSLEEIRYLGVLDDFKRTSEKGCWRMATFDEVKAYEKNVTNIKDIKKEQKGYYKGDIVRYLGHDTEWSIHTCFKKGDILKITEGGEFTVTAEDHLNSNTPQGFDVRQIEIYNKPINTMKYKVGDKLKIISIKGTHSFTIGTIVKVVGIINDGYTCKNEDAPHDSWWVTEDMLSPKDGGAFGKYPIGSIVVSTEYKLNWRKKGDMFKVLPKSYAGAIYYKDINSTDPSSWRAATKAEIKAFTSGVTNIGDIVKTLLAEDTTVEVIRERVGSHAKVGDILTIVEVDDYGIPYKCRRENGTTTWLKDENVKLYIGKVHSTIKVGDSVKVIKLHGGSNSAIGDILEVKQIDTSKIPYNCRRPDGSGTWMRAENIELYIEKTIPHTIEKGDRAKVIDGAKSSYCKTGDIVEIVGKDNSSVPYRCKSKAENIFWLSANRLEYYDTPAKKPEFPKSWDKSLSCKGKDVPIGTKVRVVCEGTTSWNHEGKMDHLIGAIVTVKYDYGASVNVEEGGWGLGKDALIFVERPSEFEVGKYYSFFSKETGIWGWTKPFARLDGKDFYGPYALSDTYFSRTSGCLTINTYDVRPATQEKIDHIEACIKAGTYVDMPKHDFEQGKYYSLFNKGTKEWYWAKKFDTVKNGNEFWGTHSISTKSYFSKEGFLNMDSYNIEPATDEVIERIRACIDAGKFVDKPKFTVGDRVKLVSSSGYLYQARDISGNVARIDSFNKAWDSRSTRVEWDSGSSNSYPEKDLMLSSEKAIEERAKKSEPIKSKGMNYIAGDSLKVLHEGSHGFKVGDIITIVKVEPNIYYCKSIVTRESRYLSEHEVTLYNLTTEYAIGVSVRIKDGRGIDRGWVSAMDRTIGEIHKIVSLTRSTIRLTTSTGTWNYRAGSIEKANKVNFKKGDRVEILSGDNELNKPFRGFVGRVSFILNEYVSVEFLRKDSGNKTTVKFKPEHLELKDIEVAMTYSHKWNREQKEGMAGSAPTVFGTPTIKSASFTVKKDQEIPMLKVRTPYKRKFK